MEAMNLNEGALDHLNSLVRFLGQPQNEGYVFATLEYSGLEPALSERIIEQTLLKKGKHIHRLILDLEESIADAIDLALEQTQADGLIIANFNQLLEKKKSGGLTTTARDRLLSLNFARERITRLEKPLLFWMSKENLQLLANLANDFYSQRRLSTFFFDLKPEILADNPHFETRFQESFRSTPDYQQLNSRANLLEEQLAEAETKGYPIHRLAKEIALPLAKLYSEQDLNQRALELLYKYAEHIATDNWQKQESIADIYIAAKQYDLAETKLEHLLAMEQVPKEKQATLWINYGDLLKERGKYPAAQAKYQQALVLLKEEGSYEEARLYERLGDIHQAQGQFEQALQFFESDLKLTQELFEANPHSESLKNGLAISYSKMGDIHQAQGQFEQALQFFEKRTKLGQELFEANPHSLTVVDGYAISLGRLAFIQQEIGQTKKCLELYNKAISIWQDLYKQTHLKKFTNYINWAKAQIKKLDNP